jgi:hypothetical protein
MPVAGLAALVQARASAIMRVLGRLVAAQAEAMREVEEFEVWRASRSE